MGEFDLIQKYFTHPSDSVLLGVGDDCAILDQAKPSSYLASSTDLLIEGRHFFSDVSPYRLGIKSLAVNLSDLAAMGATPAGCLLGLSLPEIKEDWLKDFSQGFMQMSKQYACPLIGGDTTRSSPNGGIGISVTVMGWVEKPFLTRNQACLGDEIWVSGKLGQAHVALKILQQDPRFPESLLSFCRDALEMPVPKVALGQALRGHAHAVIDISDGLAQDLGHILNASKVGANLYFQRIPFDDRLKVLSTQALHEAIFEGGDVYELCITAPKSEHHYMASLGLSCIGEIVAQDQGLCLDGHPLNAQGFQHF
ncbi:thiamine-phosphate kinase [Basilea psittacipulmonis]|uniref:Thiamine-monophosphate kinase n=1 Tax=Basilea psittacipulmonis DSM 24701 TaxID=1072685 RepID=A0A077DH39_9BURK|nr:thiamine-phosphate kinase [Basilea psittacipulmonis]AIL32488.1 hypothetical protein IX83_03470 [Basilea psittacipulmonis DSM 24701]